MRPARCVDHPGHARPRFLTISAATERSIQATPEDLIPLTVNEFRRLFEASSLHQSEAPPPSSTAHDDDAKPEPEPATTADAKTTQNRSTAALLERRNIRLADMGARGQYAKGVLKRQQILEVALEVVAQHGFRRTYVSEIAERVGLTQPGLIHYFRTREELCQEIIRARDLHDRDSIAAEFRGIEGYFAVISHNRHVPGLVQLYAEFSAEASHPGHPAHEFFRQRYASLREALVRDIELAREDGEYRGALPPDKAAYLLIAAADGLQLQWLIDDRVDMVGQLRTLWRALCAAPHSE